MGPIKGIKNAEAFAPTGNGTTTEVWLACSPFNILTYPV
jgi:hypothetical protein